MSKILDVVAEAIASASIKEMALEEVREILKPIDECQVKIYRENEDVKLPTYAKQGDACMDVYVHSIEHKDDGRVVYHTGLHFKLPEDYEMEIRPRSSNTKTIAIMQNAPGTLDEGYIGELMIVHRNIDTPFIPIAEYIIGDRVAQILIRRREQIIWDEVETIEELGKTERGAGGFGSTGK